MPKKQALKGKTEKETGTKPIAGDLVEVHLSKEIYEGTLLESPASEKEVVLLKLGSGYNIGFSKKDILEIKLIKKLNEEKKEISVKNDPKKPNIAMIITGGTIASKLDPKTGGVKWLESPENLFSVYPEIFDIANVLKIDIPFLKGSENIDFKDWQKLAKVTCELLNDPNISGIIITHGTDTLHYTASALSFFIRDLNKPVVLTYSQRSIDRGSSDATLNLKCSAIAAISDIAEVMIVGHSDTNDLYCFAMPGTKTRKLHTSRRDAFKVVNSKAFARISEEDLEILGTHNLRNKGKAKVDSSFLDKVALIKFYPGQDPSILDYYLKNGYKGLVIEMLGLGQIATSEGRLSWIKKLKEIINKGVVVCATSQTIYGRLDPLVYSTGRELLNLGIIYLKDILSETALVKLGWVLGHKDWLKDKETIKEKMLYNFANEFNHRLEE